MARLGYRPPEQEEPESEQEQQEEQEPARVPRPEAEDLSVEEEFARGADLEAELRAKDPLWHSPEALELLDDCLEHLRPALERDEIDYQFLALDSSIPFATSCSNGRVYFSRALLTGLAEEQVLFFAATELAHTERRHVATRQGRLSSLRGSVATAPGSQARQRLEYSAMLAVRHFEDFEADFQASQWLGHGFAQQSLTALDFLLRLHGPQSVREPTQASLETRIQRVSQQMPPPDPINYLYTLMEY